MKRLLIANRGVRALARGIAHMCAQRMFGDRQMAWHAKRAGR
ncbi:hypothetical protein J2W49_002806 [Hydrogenophaga palleronii]|uniref:Uncharacterized protein n=1 Tax=Hydrogenophaga palleronii TaxID=65655 RepID=A0ABU1WNK9_9BURK|nr:hypothetical protein [Hydrogenophaga palleronii]MDR7150843.1 hypothetical protein [Hydrogenophaga palleronii]